MGGGGAVSARIITLVLRSANYSLSVRFECGTGDDYAVVNVVRLLNGKPDYKVGELRDFSCSHDTARRWVRLAEVAGFRFHFVK
jgi:hypothetical protein